MGRTVRREGSFARERPARARVRKMPLALVVAIALAAGVGFPRGVAAASAAPSSTPRLRRRPPRGTSTKRASGRGPRATRAKLRARRAPRQVTLPTLPRGPDGKVHCKKCLGCSVILRRLSPSKAMLGKQVKVFTGASGR